MGESTRSQTMYSFDYLGSTIFDVFQLLKYYFSFVTENRNRTGSVVGFGRFRVIFYVPVVLLLHVRKTLITVDDDPAMT